MRANEGGRRRERVPAPGDVVLGRFELERVLAEGGMGILFAATHRALRQKVAVKFLKAAYAEDTSARERFLREARAAAAISSEHAARIHDVGETEEGVPFLVMELLEGIDLDRLVTEQKKLAPREAVGYVLEACEAIAEAHAAGIVHRDLKPSNLFRAERANGTRIVKVLDFGISKSLLPEDEPRTTNLTAPNTILGSPQYMSPEQVRDAKTVDTRTDIWALGVILYELVAGRPPFETTSVPELYALILSAEAPPLRKIAAEAPAGLSDVVARCLQRDPAARYQSVGELALALQPFAPHGSQALVTRIASAARGPVSGRPSVPAASMAPARDGIAFAPTQVAKRPVVGVLGAAVAVVVIVVVAAVAYTRANTNANAAASAAQPDPTTTVKAASPSTSSTSVSVSVTASSAPSSATAADPSASAATAASGTEPTTSAAASAPTLRPPPAGGHGPKVKDISQIQLIQ